MTSFPSEICSESVGNPFDKGAVYPFTRAVFFPAPVQSDHLRRHARRAATRQTRNPAHCPLLSLSLVSHKEQATDAMLCCMAAADELAAEIPMQMRSPPKIIDHTNERVTARTAENQTDGRDALSFHSWHNLLFSRASGARRRQFGRLE